MLLTQLGTYPNSDDCVCHGPHLSDVMMVIEGMKGAVDDPDW